MQEPNPLPWGAQDRYQAHFIVRKECSQNNYRIMLQEQFFQPKVTLVQKSCRRNLEWGLRLANILNNDDSSIKEMIIKQSVKDATIFVDPI